MRVVIVDQDLKAGRKLAASVEKMAPTADVLLYSQPLEALSGIAAHGPDVAFVGPHVNGTAGPDFVVEARKVDDSPKYVGIVDAPDPEVSTQWIAAGAKLVVARPVDSLGIRTALRHTGGGIDA
jgi:DNA-binding NarL/FixJ family response regulator